MIKVTITNRARFDVDRIVREAREKAFSRAEDELRFIRCPIHHQTATVTRTGTGLNVRGCCDTLIRTVKARLK